MRLQYLYMISNPGAEEMTSAGFGSGVQSAKRMKREKIANPQHADSDNTKYTPIFNKSIHTVRHDKLSD